MTAVQRLTQASDVVVLEEHRTRSGHCVASAMLNFEKTLNSLSLPMIEILAPQLERWQRRNDVVAILLRGAGDRAFCAGGDIQALYRGMSRNHEAHREVDDYPRRFFEAEYRLDYAIHRCPKPVIAFGHGVVMGGGLGLFSASAFRLVTERSRVAMPEVTIGLFPDAGASWILRGLPHAYAAWLGMTGSQMTAADALHIGLGTHSIAAAAWPALVDALLGATWTGDGATDRACTERCIASVERPPLPDSALVAHRSMLEDALPTLPTSVRDTAQRLTGLAGRDDYVDRGLATMRNGCPTSVGIVQGQLERIPPMTLADAFRMELTLATHCAANPDCLEGVRALIIDKDNKPAWRYPTVDALPAEYVASHFEAPWDVHPLADLGEA